MATALLAGWGNSDIFLGLFSFRVVKSYLLMGGFFEGRNLIHGYSRSSFQRVCVIAKYKVSKSVGGLRFSKRWLLHMTSAHCSHLPPATFCESDVYLISASVWQFFLF